MIKNKNRIGEKPIIDERRSTDVKSGGGEVEDSNEAVGEEKGKEMKSGKTDIFNVFDCFLVSDRFEHHTDKVF